tara:strand:+ start:223 stop:381 length:159 start_codon:yes stop_codon:yes gene_type:complete
VQEALELLAETHRDDEDEAHYDCVLDVLDLVVGWCAVGCELYPVEYVEREGK